MANYKKTIKNLLFFNEPIKTETFILKETNWEQEKNKKQEEEEKKENKEKNKENKEKSDKNKEESDENKEESDQNKEKSDQNKEKGDKNKEESDENKEESDKNKEESDQNKEKSDENKEESDENKSEGKNKSKGKNKNAFIKKVANMYFEEEENKESKSAEKKSKDSNKKTEISKKLSENMEHMKKIYSIPLNGDILLREFDVVVKEKVIPAFILFFDGMVDRKVINDDILQSMMIMSNFDIRNNGEDTASFIKNHLLTHNQIKEVKEYNKVVNEVNIGACAIFVDGMDSAFVADVKGWEHRMVERPNTELILRGPQEGFGEIIRVNTALVRKIIRDEDLIAENIIVGRRSRTPCSIMYIKDIANNSIVEEVKRRIESIKVDYMIDSGELEQYIEDSSLLPAPQIIATERPDRVADGLIDGKVAIIVHGSPFALVLPSTAHDLIHSSEDSYIRFPYTNLLRGIRIIGILFSILLPGLYIAITNFHHEMIPTDLLLAIEASREKVPFPTVVEILIMEISFELIREAGIRIPGPIGPTLGIIGALILGQAAVTANIVSPILIIIVALTGIGSFAVPNFSLGFSFRTLRFVYIFLGAIAGFLGITVGVFLQGIWLVSAKSFGVPFLAPFAPRTKGGLSNEIIRAPIWKQEERPDYLNTKDDRKQAKISRGWIKNKKEDNDKSEK